MSVRLLVHENFPNPAVRVLRDKGVEVVTVAESMPGASDAAVLAAAREQERRLVAYDRDYGELVFSRRLPPPPAIVYLRQGPYPPSRPADFLLTMIADPATVAGFFLVVGEQTLRRRRVP